MHDSKLVLRSKLIEIVTNVFENLRQTLKNTMLPSLFLSAELNRCNALLAPASAEYFGRIDCLVAVSDNHG